jgi:glycosyltransferase involved in cell wall biosynthesis
MEESGMVKLLILVVAYNAQPTLEAVLDRIPKSVLEHDYEILLIDDRSTDETFATAGAYKGERPHLNTRVLSNPESRGYGGNQKIGFHYAVKQGFDVVALLHADGKYAPERLEDLIAPIVKGEADAVFGTRFDVPGRARREGMPLFRRRANRFLTRLQNRLLKTRFTELHSGCRAYAVKALSMLPFQYNADGWHFDTEIAIQLLLSGKRIVEVSIPAYSGTEIKNFKGFAYAWNVLRATVGSRLHSMQLYYKRQFDILGPRVDYPLKLGYRSSHTLALDAVKPGSRVLDIGCGNGAVGAELERKGCEVTGVDGALFLGECRLKCFARIDLSTQPVPFQPSEFDVILLLDVIEHLDGPRQYDLLDDLRARSGGKKPLFVITAPNVAFLPMRLLLLFGTFNYGKRGILDQTHRRLFTFKSLERLLIQCGYAVHRVKGIPAPYPAAIGLDWKSKTLLAVNRALIALCPKLFSYQVFMTATPLPTAEQLLAEAEGWARRRQG